jgi:hypothetical protein
MAEFTFRLPWHFDPTPDVITPDSIFDLDEWTEWLAGYDFDVNEVFRIEINYRRRQATIFSFRVTNNGRKYAWGNEVATMDPVTVNYDTLPTWT